MPSQKRSHRLCVSFAALAAVAGAVVLGSPAGATSTSLPFSGCSATTDNGACISAISVDYTPSTITLGITVGRATDPTTDPNWDPAMVPSENATGIVWNIFVGGSATPTWAAVATDEDNPSGPPSFIGGVLSYVDPTSGVCAGTTSFSTSANTYGLSFPASCVSNPASIAVDAEFLYSNAGTQDADIEPADGSACCSATPSSAPTPAPTPTPTPTPTPSGQHGYWLVGSDGGIFTFGSAQFYGSTGGTKLNAPVVAMAGSSNSGGYWLVGADAGIFNYGNAQFAGSGG